MHPNFWSAFEKCAFNGYDENSDAAFNTFFRPDKSAPNTSVCWEIGVKLNGEPDQADIAQGKSWHGDNHEIGTIEGRGST